MNSTETPVTPPATTATSAATENKTVAIVSYLTLIGFIVALIIHMSAKTQLGAFHLRQSLGLILGSIALGIVSVPLMMIPFIGWLANLVLFAGLFVLWVMGLIGAIKGETKPVPVIGAQFQTWFAKAFE